MKINTKKCSNILYTLLIKIALVIAIALFLLFAVSSFFKTSFIDSSYSEIIHYKWDHSFLHVGIFILLIVVVYLLYSTKYYVKINNEKIVRALMIFSYAFGTIWVLISHSAPVADRLSVSMIATQFINHDYSALEVGNYLFNFPFQLGIVAFLQVCYKFAGDDFYLFAQLLNPLAVSLSFYFLYKISSLIFEKKEQVTMIAFSFFGCIAAMFFCTYVYGNLFGLFFAVMAIYFEIKYLKNNRLGNMIVAVVAICLSALIKNNYLIVLIAMAIMLFIKFVRERKILSLCMIVLLFASFLLSYQGMIKHYENKSGMEIGSGIPKTLFVAMGLQDCEKAPGWYNGYTVITYANSGFDTEIAEATGKESIISSINKFKSNPSYAYEFFKNKTLSQWNEPTFLSIWESNCSNNHIWKLSDFVKSVYYGKWNSFFVGVMNFYHLFVWSMAAFFLIYNRKTLNYIQLFFAIIIIGGFIFHSLFEAKSQYVIQYFILAIPYAGAGFYNLMEVIHNRLWKSVKKINVNQNQE